MQRSSFALGAVASGAFLLACGGINPNDFGAQPAPVEQGGQAGYSYDAGVSSAGSKAGAGGGGKQQGTWPPSPGAAGQDDTQGDAGADNHGHGEAGDGGIPGAGGSVGGTGVVAPDAGQGGAGAGRGGAGGQAGAGRGGAGGQAGSWSWGGRGGTSAGGRGGADGDAGRAGRAGAGAGGVGGRSGDGGSAGKSEPPPVHDLVFSEYVEARSSKALEIRAGRASTLSGCELLTYANGNAIGSTIALEGEIASGGVYVLCTSALELVTGDACDRATALRFNGNDAVALACGGVVLDVIGRIGEDPGTAWQSGETSTLGQTLRRRCSVPLGDTNGTDPFDPSAAWIALPGSTFDGLGDPACAEVAPVPGPETSAD